MQTTINHDHAKVSSNLHHYPLHHSQGWIPAYAGMTIRGENWVTRMNRVVTDVVRQFVYKAVAADAVTADAVTADKETVVRT